MFTGGNAGNVGSESVMSDLNSKEPNKLSDAELQDFVASTDSGARDPEGIQRVLLLGTALCWSLFQLWIASPLPFYDWPLIGSFGVFNDTESRSIHLAFAVFLSLWPIPP